MKKEKLREKGRKGGGTCDRENEMKKRISRKRKEV